MEVRFNSLLFSNTTEWKSGQGVSTQVFVTFRPFKIRFLDKKSEEVRRLGMGRLFADLSRRLEHKAQNGAADPLKILVHSTHDTGIAPMAASLGVYDDRYELSYNYRGRRVADNVSSFPAR